MSDERLRDAYERGLPAGAERAPLDDLAAERLRRVVDREGDEMERLHTIDQLLSTAEGRLDLDLAWAVSRAARPTSTRRRWWGLAAAAAGLALLPVVWLSGRDTVPVLRGTDASVAVVGPRGAVAGPDAARFIWRSIPGDVRFRLILVTLDGTERYTAETMDTVLVLPDSVRLAPGVDHQWWIEARAPDGDRASSRPTVMRTTR